jgi:uncharacterized protein YoxC
MKNILSLTLLTLIWMMSCEEKKKEAKDVLYEQVMEVHDEIMPKMGDIMKYKKQLKSKVDALAENAEVNSEKIGELQQAITDLDNSHEEMMAWMREFNPDFEGMVSEEIMKYLVEQKAKIERVGKETYAALKQAEELLNE